MISYAPVYMLPLSMTWRDTGPDSVLVLLVVDFNDGNNSFSLFYKPNGRKFTGNKLESNSSTSGQAL